VIDHCAAAVYVGVDVSNTLSAGGTVEADADCVVVYSLVTKTYSPCVKSIDPTLSASE